MSVRRRAYLCVKRVVDVVVSGAGLLVTAPAMAAVAVAVRRDLGSPVLFRQTRPGRDGRPFELVKFRTMRTLSSSDGVDTDAQRLTPFGRAKLVPDKALHIIIFSIGRTRIADAPAALSFWSVSQKTDSWQSACTAKWPARP